MQRTTEVITVENVYTHATVVVCAKHYEALRSDAWQVQCNWQEGWCWECDRDQVRADEGRPTPSDVDWTDALTAALWAAAYNTTEWSLEIGTLLGLDLVDYDADGAVYYVTGAGVDKLMALRKEN